MPWKTFASVNVSSTFTKNFRTAALPSTTAASTRPSRCQPGRNLWDHYASGEYFFHAEVPTTASDGIELATAVGPDRIGDPVVGYHAFVVPLLITVVDARA